MRASGWGAARLALVLTVACAQGAGLVALSGCDDGGEAREAYLAQMRAADEEAIAAGLEQELSRMKDLDEDALARIAGALDEAAVTSLETYGCTPEELCRHLLTHFDYTVDAIEVTGEDTATVEVTIENVDLEAALSAAHDRLVTGDAATRLQEGYAEGVELSLMRSAMDVIFEEIDGCEDTITSQVTLALTKDQDLWEVDEDGYIALLSAVLGGIEVPAT